MYMFKRPSAICRRPLLTTKCLSTGLSEQDQQPKVPLEGIDNEKWPAGGSEVVPRRV